MSEVGRRLLIGVCLAAVAAVAAAQGSSGSAAQTYQDPQGRFRFAYPASFGAPSRGTNDGFGDRVAAIRFADFSSGVREGRIVLGGEAVVTRGFPLIDVQALGGLYDSMALEALPDPLRARVLASLVTLSSANFCGELAKARHLDPGSAGLASLSQPQKDALASLDAMRNVDPRVVRCEAAGAVVTFQKETTFRSGAQSGRQHVYGAVRFLGAPFSTFQLVRATPDPPAPGVLDAMTALVVSYQGLSPASKNP